MIRNVFAVGCFSSHSSKTTWCLRLTGSTSVWALIRTVMLLLPLFVFSACLCSSFYVCCYFCSYAVVSTVVLAICHLCDVFFSLLCVRLPSHSVARICILVSIVVLNCPCCCHYVFLLSSLVRPFPDGGVSK